MQIDDAREFIKFLHGAVPWNGTWFGEYAPGERGAYWWRKHLDEAIAALIAAPAAPQQAEPVEQIGWADEFGNLFPMGAWKPAQRTHHDSRARLLGQRREAADRDSRAAVPGSGDNGRRQNDGVQAERPGPARGASGVERPHSRAA